jgi:pyruvate kinase
MRKTKIICTIGPASEKPEMLEKLIEAGMNVARLNFSHGSYEEHGARIENIRKLREKLGKPIAILLDTKGPEIRLKSFKEGKVDLKPGKLFTLCHDDVEGDETKCSITCENLFRDVQRGGKILLDDGLIELSVEKVEGQDIVCRVVNGGKVSNNKGVNVPDVHVSLPFLNDKDRSDIMFGIEKDVDFIAASFVRCAEDVRQIRALLDVNGGKNIEIISKIENKEAIQNIDEIIAVSDGIMIARGDLGVEVPYEEVPSIQKMIIKKVYEAGKRVITATQMLDSMQNNPRPTRAEATDVANAIYDGTSAIMLSGETAAGKYPVEAVETMVRIALHTEADIDYRKRFFVRERKANSNVTDAICHATCTTALDLNAKAIVTITLTGASARMISRYRPHSDIIACTTDEKVCRKLNLSWGVTPIMVEKKERLMELFDHVADACLQNGLVEKNDIIVITAGVPLGVSGMTNMRNRE